MSRRNRDWAPRGMHSPRPSIPGFSRLRPGKHPLGFPEADQSARARARRRRPPVAGISSADSSTEASELRSAESRRPRLRNEQLICPLRGQKSREDVRREKGRSRPRPRRASRRRPPVAGVSSAGSSAEASDLPSGESRRPRLRNGPAAPAARAGTGAAAGGSARVRVGPVRNNTGEAGWRPGPPFPAAPRAAPGGPGRRPDGAGGWGLDGAL